MNLLLRFRTAVFCLVIGIFISGAYSYLNASLEALPDIRDRVIAVDVIWKGQPANNVETQVTTPIEQTLINLKYVTDLTSFTANGITRIELKFQTDTSINEMFNEVNSRLNGINDLPSDIEKPVVSILGGGANKIATIVFYGSLESNNWVTEQNKIKSSFAADIKSLTGVKEVKFWGNYPPQVSIIFDKDKLSALQLNPSDIVAKIQNRFTSTHSAATNVGKREHSILIDTNLVSIENLKMLPLLIGNLTTVYLKDIADIKLDYDQDSNISYVNGDEGIVIDIIANNRVDQTKLAGEIREAVQQYNLTSANNKAFVFYDGSKELTLANKHLVNSLLIACALSFLTVFVFSQRHLLNSVTVFSAVPFSFFTTYLILTLIEHTTNMLVLVGLAFASGMVIDNAIVVVDAILKKRRQGNDSFRSIYKGVTSTSNAIFSGTLTTIIAMLPIFTIGNGMGLLLKDMLIPVAIALTTSLIYAIFIVPFILALSSNIKSNSSRNYSFINHMPTRFIYQLLIVVSVLFVCFTLVFKFIPAPGFMPDSRTSRVIGNVFPEPSLNFETKKELMYQLESYLSLEQNQSNEPEFLYLSSNSSPPSFIFRTDNKEEAIVLNETLMTQPNILPDAFLSSSVSTLLPQEKSANITLYVAGSDFIAMSKVAKRIWGQIPQVIPNASVSYPWVGVNALQKKVTLDGRKVYDAGFSQHEVATDIAAHMNEVLIMRSVINNQLHDLILETSDRSVPLELLQLYSRTLGPTMVSQLGDIEEHYIASYIPHKNGERVISMTISLPPKTTLGEAASLIQKQLLDTLILPSGVRVKFDENLGEFEMMKAQSKGMLILSAAFVFLVLIAFFSDVRAPILLIVSTIPALAGGIIGVNFATVALGINFNLIVASGFILLMGIVINNSILIVNELQLIRKRTSQKVNSLLISEAINNRASAIITSTVTSIIGFVPLIINPSSGGGIYAGIAAVMIFGLLTSLASTFYFLPSLILATKRLLPIKN